MNNSADLIVIGAGAAGLMCAIWAKRTAPEKDVLLLDRATRLGAKILISGGGRCNVTHFEVHPSDFCGSSQQAIKQILHQFTVEQTCAFFNALGVGLKREPTGKLFPETDRAQTVLDALLKEARFRGVRLEHPVRVRRVEPAAQGFTVETNRASYAARRIVIASGGKSFPKTGSDGSGYDWVRALGHTLTEDITPSLVPLTLPKQHFIRCLSGLSADVSLELRSATGKRMRVFSGALLCTHFGISGPVVLDCSRHWLAAKRDDPGCTLYVQWTPSMAAETWERILQTSGRKQAGALLKQSLPERLGQALCESAGVDPLFTCDRINREQRKRLVRMLTAMPLPVSGDRGFDYAEVTAGGVPLSELRLKTMESRVSPGLYLCGEICDVDGRIGGFNFQWAWSSGVVAGRAAAEASRRD